ncbi:hypothetical protein GCM10029964_112120 [Kibdelosporangium lantanae]
MPYARGQRAVQAALVRHENRVRDTVALVEAGEQLGRVGQLGHPLRVDETRRFEHPEAGVGEPVEELQLHADVHDRLLVLQPVARADLPDGDFAREVGPGRHDGRQASGDH